MIARQRIASLLVPGLLIAMAGGLFTLSRLAEPQRPAVLAPANVAPPALPPAAPQDIAKAPPQDLATAESLPQIPVAPAVSAPAANALVETPVRQSPIPIPPAAEPGPDTAPAALAAAPAADIPPDLTGDDANDDAAAADSADPPPALTQVTLRAGPGDTLVGLLVDAGIPRAEAHTAIQTLRRVFDPRDLKPGHEIRLSFHPDAADGSTASGRLQGMELAAAVDRTVAVHALPDGGFAAEAATTPLNLTLARRGGEIAGGSLMAAGMASGVPAGVVTEMIRLFSYDVDFQRDIQPGDRYDLMYERYEVADGRLARAGAVIYAALTLSGKTYRLYRYRDSAGRVDYYDERGQSVRKALLKTPIDGARLSSGYGMRTNPILGYSMMHRGVDFAAPSGTPIYAAGDGTVDVIGPNASYGRYIRLRHSGTFGTAYAHMSRFAPGLHKGSRVRQGQVIGYVGTTGRSTGAHLHYEVLREGKQVNPMSVKFPSGDKLAGSELVRFDAMRREVDHALPALLVASTSAGPLAEDHR